MTKKSEILLKEIERGIKFFITNKFAQAEFIAEENLSRKACEISVIAKSMGESLIKANETIEFPLLWRRLLKRKDCPKYMKLMDTYDVHAYYPRLSLPKEDHWVSFDRIEEI